MTTKSRKQVDISTQPVLAEMAKKVSDQSALADSGFSSHNVCTVNSDDIPKEVRMASPYTYHELFNACLEMVRVTSKLEKEGLIPDTCLHMLSHAQLSAHDLYVELSDHLAEARLRKLGEVSDE